MLLLDAGYLEAGLDGTEDGEDDEERNADRQHMVVSELHDEVFEL